MAEILPTITELDVDLIEMGDRLRPVSRAAIVASNIPSADTELDTVSVSMISCPTFPVTLRLLGVTAMSAIRASSVMKRPTAPVAVPVVFEATTCQ